MIAAPEVIAAAATDLTSPGSTISVANAAAAANTTELLAAGADEVSAAIAALFGAHGQAHQALSAQAVAFHSQFVQNLAAGGASYAAADAAAVSPLLAPINAQFLAATGRPLIGNGANGAPGTGANGAPGGWLIGNGGAGGSGAAGFSGGPAVTAGLPDYSAAVGSAAPAAPLAPGPAGPAGRPGCSVPVAQAAPAGCCWGHTASTLRPAPRHCTPCSNRRWARSTGPFRHSPGAG